MNKVLFGLFVFTLLTAGCALSKKSDQNILPDKNTATDEATCKDQCGDSVCEEIVCMAVGCPCAETQESCPADCS